MYLGLFFLFVGLVVTVSTKKAVGSTVATAKEVHSRINWAIFLFETNLLGLAGGMCLKHGVGAMKISLLSFAAVIAVIIVMIFAANFVNNINEGIFNTYRYFTTDQTKGFHATLILSMFFWLAVYYYF